MTEEWNFTDKIEEMTPEQLKARIEKAWNHSMPKIVPVPYVGKIPHEVTYYYEELTARCPMTGIQDLYKVTIEFVPDKLIPELKSLKYYYMAYRDLPISHEHLHAKIFKDFKEAIKPTRVRVNLDVAIRGGIKTDISYVE